MRHLLTIFFTTLVTSLFGQQQDSTLSISRLTGDFFIFTTYNTYKGEKIPANGMYLITNKGAVIFDSPWDTTQLQPLLDSIRIKHNQKAVMCIATHFHADRTGGLAYYRQQGITTYTTKRTDELSKVRGMKRAEFLIDQDTIFKIGQYTFQTLYPGEGHAADNIVIWFETQKILYGGCLIKSAADTDLGNLGDANVKTYAATIRKVQQKCQRPQHIVPGHGDWTNIRSLRHTLEMAEKLKK